MKNILPAIIFMLPLYYGCSRSETLSLTTTHQQVIGLQPLDSFDTGDMQSLTTDLSAFFHKKIVILKTIPLPHNYYNGKLKMYSADSIATYLHYLKPDSIASIVGLTHMPIFTIKKAKDFDYFEEDIFGHGYQPGYASVVSDHKIRNRNPKFLRQVLKNGIVHELGHNMGLSHCPDEKCVMHKLITGNNYCESCRKKLIILASR